MQKMETTVIAALPRNGVTTNSPIKAIAHQSGFLSASFFSSRRDFGLCALAPHEKVPAGERQTAFRPATLCVRRQHELGVPLAGSGDVCDHRPWSFPGLIEQSAETTRPDNQNRDDEEKLRKQDVTLSEERYGADDGFEKADQYGAGQRAGY